MFSYSFDKIQKKSQRYWHYHKHDLMIEFYGHSRLPAPFSILALLMRFIQHSQCCQRWKPIYSFISSINGTLKVKLEELKTRPDTRPQVAASTMKIESLNDGRMDGLTDQQTDQQTDKPSSSGLIKAWADGGKWSSQFAKRLRRWEGVIAKNYWSNKNINDNTSNDKSSNNNDNNNIKNNNNNSNKDNNNNTH